MTQPHVMIIKLTTRSKRISLNLVSTLGDTRRLVNIRRVYLPRASGHLCELLGNRQLFFCDGLKDSRTWKIAQTTARGVTPLTGHLTAFTDYKDIPWWVLQGIFFFFNSLFSSLADSLLPSLYAVPDSFHSS